MNQPWYWYIETSERDGRMSAVRINYAPAFSVRGKYWVIPFRMDERTRWNVYLKPKDWENINGEWVFHHREQVVPVWHKPRVVEYCPHCGSEVEV